jgi:hypothetical protein
MDRPNIMKNYLRTILILLSLAQPVGAAQISTTTATVTISGSTVTAQVSPARTPGYYRLAYDVTSKKIKALVFSIGITETINGLYCADTYVEIQAYATANNLTGLPKDPNAQP